MAGLLARSIGWLCEERQARWAARVAVVLIVIDSAYDASLLLGAPWRDVVGYDATLDRGDEVLILVTLLFHGLAALIVLGRVGDLGRGRVTASFASGRGSLVSGLLSQACWGSVCPRSHGF